MPAKLRRTKFERVDERERRVDLRALPAVLAVVVPRAEVRADAEDARQGRVGQLVEVLGPEHLIAQFVDHVVAVGRGIAGVGVAHPHDRGGGAEVQIDLDSALGRTLDLAQLADQVVLIAEHARGGGQAGTVQGLGPDELGELGTQLVQLGRRQVRRLIGEADVA